MSDYIVSARKYRPMSWQQVVGQDALTTTLKNAIRSGRLAHAYLFCGPRGVGKTTSARIFARTINCLNPTPDFVACGECESCRAFNEGRSFNIHELDAASNNSVDDIRQLTEQVQIPPQVGRYKVFIIDEVHMLSAAAFNAFLKTLEEPPAHVIFILATTEKHKILPTILSRCQTFDFNRMTIADTVEHLQMVAQREGYTAEPEALAVIAQKADGGMRDALSIFDQVAGYTQGNITYQRVIENLNVLDYDYYFKMVDLLLDKKVPESMILLDEVLSKGFDAGHFISGLATHFRNVMMSRDAATLPLLQCSEQVRERYRQQAQRCQDKYIYRALKLCNNCDINYRPSRNKRLLVEVTLVQVAMADEDPAGRRPANTLPHIFNLSEPRVSADAPQKPAANEAPNPAPTPARQPQPQPQPTPSRAATPKRLVNISIKTPSINIQPRQTAAAPQPAPTPEVNAEERSPRKLDQELLEELWREFVIQLPQAETAMRQRMQTMNPTMTAEQTFEVTVANLMVEEDVRKYVNRVETFMTQQLGGNAVHMTVRLMEQHEQRRILSRPEMFAEMIKNNRLVAAMQATYHLELR